MTKKYFAKYLPTPGEIREGDMYFNYEGVLKKAKTPDSYSNPFVSYFDGGKKATLFLCSRDIGVGDIVFRGFEKFCKATEAYCKHPQSQDFKVVGEISPHAIWVREGDVFDLTDLNPLSAAGIEHNRPLTYFIKIKCPTCKEFH